MRHFKLDVVLNRACDQQGMVDVNRTGSFLTRIRLESERVLASRLRLGGAYLAHQPRVAVWLPAGSTSPAKGQPGQPPVIRRAASVESARLAG